MQLHGGTPTTPSVCQVRYWLDKPTAYEANGAIDVLSCSSDAQKCDPPLTPMTRDERALSI